VKIGYSIALLIVLFLAALAVSGCSGGSPPAAPCPTPASPAGTPAPAATWSAVASPATVDQLFHLDALGWYSYRANITSGGVNLSSAYRFEHGAETYGGVAAKHTRAIANDTVTGLESVDDLYASAADSRSLGGVARSFLYGMPTGEISIPAGQGMNYLDIDLAHQARANSKAPLTRGGDEKVTVDGKTYSCTRYVYTTEGVAYTAWYTPQAPAPVKVAWVDQGIGSTAYMTLELLDWG